MLDRGLIIGPIEWLETIRMMRRDFRIVYIFTEVIDIRRRVECQEKFR